MRLRTLIAAIVTVLAVASPAAAQTPEPIASELRTNLSDIEDEVLCLVCGTTLELTDDAPQAEQLRDQIRGLIDKGLTKDEIKDELVAEYGDAVLATPGTEGFDLTAWVLPGLAIVLAGGAIASGLARNRRRPDADGPVTGALTAEESIRLDTDLESFDG